MRCLRIEKQHIWKKGFSPVLHLAMLVFGLQEAFKNKVTVSLKKKERNEKKNVIFNLQPEREAAIYLPSHFAVCGD